MLLRQITEDDFPQLLTIEEDTQPVPWTLAAFMRCWEAGYPGWVLEHDKRILGFALISVGAGECHILNICITPDFQHQGLGRNLMIYCMQWAMQKGAQVVYLEVRRSNANAIRLYRNMNFKLIGERKNYYPMAKGAEDALIFAREIGIEDLVSGKFDPPWIED